MNNRIPWRRGGASPTPELPELRVAVSVQIVVVLHRGEWRQVEQRGLDAMWRPGGKWWRECSWWCYADDLLATLPTEKPE